MLHIKVYHTALRLPSSEKGDYKIVVIKKFGTLDDFFFTLQIIQHSIYNNLGMLSMFKAF